ncbi:L-threonine aldolase [Luteibacter sp. UNCMF331Sha3.1]|uniref:threonine aldolase family protein n=1 Tax=Luteibacter sp. UNCMF331Sha3.1 TaxID=1502760 RepID=UPI0008B88873|nr:beta-eliminating lyase-related protein [Luteibacter sp. UNCMF331Sha3.1]SEM35903.1 L-threonine aldolase [Luteibacter sp. UNCMF331Sha3.1]
MVSRREFMQVAPLGALSLAGLGLPWAPALAAVRGPEDIPVDLIVSFLGDNVPSKPEAVPARLIAAMKGRDDVADVYFADGATGALEKQFAQMVGKEDAAFIPSGTMANQIAIRLHCASRPRVLLQDVSHVYRDESDAIAIMNAIHAVPVEGGASAGLADAMAAAFTQSAEDPFPVEVGAVSIESPVRRLDGATVSAATIGKIAALARAKGARMHLDGARLLLMCGMPGFDVRDYCAPFDSVYVSLYKYLDAPFGAILAGDKAFVAKARQARHIFGGNLYHGWTAAIVASKTLTGFEQRFGRVRAAADDLLTRLAGKPGIEVQRVENGSNVAFLKLDERIATGLRERLLQSDIAIRTVREGRLRLAFNETLLRKSPATIAGAF